MSTENNDPNAPGETGGFKPIATQEQLNAVISDRLDRERSKFSDYDRLKADSAELAKLRAAEQTAEERFNERISKLEADLAVEQIEKHRLRAVTAHGLDEADIEFLTGSTPEAITEQAKRLSERVADRKRAGNTAPTEGTNPGQPSADPMRDFVRQAFSQQG